MTVTWNIDLIQTEYNLHLYIIFKSKLWLAYLLQLSIADLKTPQNPYHKVVTQRIYKKRKYGKLITTQGLWLIKALQLNY